MILPQRHSKTRTVLPLRGSSIEMIRRSCAAQFGQSASSACWASLPQRSTGVTRSTAHHPTRLSRRKAPPPQSRKIAPDLGPYVFQWADGTGRTGGAGNQDAYARLRTPRLDHHRRADLAFGRDVRKSALPERHAGLGNLVDAAARLRSQHSRDRTLAKPVTIGAVRTCVPRRGVRVSLPVTSAARAL
jgi:hypothetical protein